MSDFQKWCDALIAAGQQLYAQGMVPATSGNLSARLDNGNFAITVSGRHKGKLTQADIMEVDGQGQSLDDRQPSAEMLLHLQIYHRFTDVRVVLHPHSVNATVLSRLCGDILALQDYEILKAFPGVDSHDGEVLVPVFDNDQDIARLADKVAARMVDLNRVHGYLIRGHGFYTWGISMEDALRHVEAFEFMFDCEMQLRGKTV